MYFEIVGEIVRPSRNAAGAERRSLAFSFLLREAGARLRALRLHRRPRGIAALFGEDEGSALVELGAWVRAGLLVPEHLFGVGLAVVLRTVSEPLGVRVVVPAAPVAGDPVHDLEADARAIDSERHELREIARREPDREPPLVHRPRIDVADAHAHHFHSVLVGVEAAERLAERLRHAVAAVGLRDGAVIDGLVAAVEADGVVAGREHDAARAVPPRGLEGVVGADDVRAQDHLPRAFDGEAAEVDDRGYALRHAQHVAQAGAVAADEFLALREVPDRADVGEAQGVAPRELAAQMTADVAGGARDEDLLHASLLGDVFARRASRVACFAFTAPLGTRPCTISAACATVSNAWCSIACGVRPPKCGVAMTSGRAAMAGLGICTSARPTSMAQPASRPESRARASAASSTRLPRETLTKKAPRFMPANAASFIRFSVSGVAVARHTT